jgi:hypothetical protein
MRTSADSLVRAADPLDPDELRAWTTSQSRERIARDIIATPSNDPAAATADVPDWWPSSWP